MQVKIHNFWPHCTFYKLFQDFINTVGTAKMFAGETRRKGKRIKQYKDDINKF